MVRKCYGSSLPENSSMVKTLYNRLSSPRRDVAFWMTVGSTSAAFLMMFQIYMVAPIIDDMAKDLGADGELMGLIIPSITIPLGLSALMSGKLTFWIGERKLALYTAFSLALGALLISFSPNGFCVIACRIITGLALGALLPLSFRFTSQNYPIAGRFFPIMIIVFGMAAGMTFGPVLGGVLYPLMGWRVEFLIVSLLSAVFFVFVFNYSSRIKDKARAEGKIRSWKKTDLGETCRGGNLCILMFILLNGIFHSGLFVWTSTVLTVRYALGEIPLGFLLLDFGLPGLVLVVILGIFSKGPSRLKMEFLGLAILGFCITLIILKVTPWLTFLAIALLSVGYNITQPLFFGIVGRMGNSHKAQIAVQLGCCFLFVGYGLGPVIFGFLMGLGSLSSILFLLFLVACLATISRAVFQDRD